MNDLKEENIDFDEILNIVNGIKKFSKRTSIKMIVLKIKKKDYPDKIEKLEEAILNYMGENDLKNLKTVLPDNNWKYLNKKLALPNEYFNFLNDYKKLIENLKKEDISVN